MNAISWQPAEPAKLLDRHKASPAPSTGPCSILKARERDEEAEEAALLALPLPPAAAPSLQQPIQRQSAARCLSPLTTRLAPSCRFAGQAVALRRHLASSGCSRWLRLPWCRLALLCLPPLAAPTVTPLLHLPSFPTRIAAHQPRKLNKAKLLAINVSETWCAAWLLRGTGRLE